MVRETLEACAARGLFHDYTDAGTAHGRTEFRLAWYARSPFRLLYDKTRRSLTFRNVLPHIPARSAMYVELRAFLQHRHSTQLPEHRRVDARRARVSCTNRGGSVSVTVTFRGQQPEYGTRTAITVVTDIFKDFLADERYFEYLTEHFTLDADVE